MGGHVEIGQTDQHQIEGEQSAYPTGTAGKVYHAEHHINLGHCPQLHNTSTLCTKLIYRSHHQGSNNMNSEMTSASASHGNLSPPP
jgi:hypothetical protein